MLRIRVIKSFSGNTTPCSFLNGKTTHGCKWEMQNYGRLLNKELKSSPPAAWAPWKWVWPSLLSHYFEFKKKENW